MQVANSRCKILRLWGKSTLKLNGNEMEWESCKNYFCINQYRAAELFRHSLEMNHSYSYNYDLNYNYDSFHVHFLLCICLLFRHMDVPSVSISVTRIKVKVGETFLRMTRPTWSDLCQFGERYFEAGHPHFHSVDSTLLVWDFTSTSHLSFPWGYFWGHWPPGATWRSEGNCRQDFTGGGASWQDWGCTKDIVHSLNWTFAEHWRKSFFPLF